MKKLHGFLFSFLLCFVTLTFFATSSFAIETVYVTPKGKAYHVKDCRSLARSKTILTMNILEAKERGYRACKICVGSSAARVANISNKQSLSAST